MKTFACRACNKQIGFILSLKSGKRIPVDPDSVMRTEVEDGKNPYKTLVTDQGITLSNPPIGQIGFIPHWSTCTDPKQFRKSKTPLRKEQ